jgi:23S rRNA (guanosine2251-2'-O)-methyltransferase
MAKKFDNIIFGLHPVEEALLEHRDIDKIMVSRDERKPDYIAVRKLAKQNQIFIQEVPKEKLNRITMKNHQGIIAFTSPIEFQSIENLLPFLYEQGKDPLLLALDGVTDIRNFGALARTAECSGVDGVLIPQKGGAPINGDAMKTSAGALLKIPVSKSKSLINTIKFLKDSGVQIVSCSEKGTDTIYQADMSVPTVIVMGGEDEGISGDILKISDKVVQIPMYGTINSLNVSVAGAVIMFEAARQRNAQS